MDGEIKKTNLVEKKEKEEKEEKEEAFVDPTGATLLSSSSEDLNETTCTEEGTCLAPTADEVAAALAQAAEKKEAEAAAAAAAVTSGDKTAPVVVSKRTAAYVTEEDWTHMQSYTEPQHLSLHTSQLSGVRTGIRSQSSVVH